jgi:WD repeat-containing protein 48
MPARPAIVRHAVLNDKLHILTLDTAGNVSLWDVLRCRVTETCDGGGEVRFTEWLKELQRDITRLNWFTVRLHMGELQIVLEPPACFYLEVRASDLGLSGGDLLVNVCSLLLKSIFAGIGDECARGKEESPPPRFDLPSDTLVL